MKVCIFGVGAIGSILAAGLARLDGLELSAIARGAQLEAIKRRGLRLLDDGGESLVRLAATDDPAELGPQDIVLTCLKAHQAWASADQMSALLGPATSVVTCQNGIPWWYFHGIGGTYQGRRLDSVDRDDRQWRAIGPQRVVGCSIYAAAEVVEPGCVRHLFGKKFLLGEPDGTVSARLRQISKLLQDAGIDAPVCDDIRSEIWLKLWGNLTFNPLSALTRATLDVIARDPGTRALARSMMLEAQEVAERLGARFEIDVDRRLDISAGVGAHRTSMLQDLEAGKAMEIDALVTVVQEMARMVEVATPVIDSVLALVQQLGRTQGLYPTYPDK